MRRGSEKEATSPQTQRMSAPKRPQPLHCAPRIARACSSGWSTLLSIQLVMCEKQAKSVGGLADWPSPATCGSDAHTETTQTMAHISQARTCILRRFLAKYIWNRSWQVGFGQPILCHKCSDSASLALYSIVKVRNLGSEGICNPRYGANVNHSREKDRKSRNGRGYKPRQSVTNPDRALSLNAYNLGNRWVRSLTST